MNEQESIFDTSFDSSVSIRRRQLLPLALKIYVWFFIAAGCLLLLRACWSFITVIQNVTGGSLLESMRQRVLYIGFAIYSFVPGAIFLLISICIWREAKWAIRINWGIGVILLVGIVSNIVGFYRDMSEGWTDLIPVVVFVPYWVMLFRIQKKWEQVVPAKK